MTSQQTLEALDRYFNSLPKKSLSPKYFTWFEYRSIQGLNNLELFLKVMSGELRFKKIGDYIYFKKSKLVRGLSFIDFTKHQNFN